MEQIDNLITISTFLALRKTEEKQNDRFQHLI